MNDLLKVSNLQGGYNEGVDVLHGIDLTIQEGCAVGIIGLNGSGKSTLGKAIMNMIPFRRGDIVYNGESIASLSTHELVKRGISIMQQGGQVFPNLSVWENLEMAFSSGMESFNRLRDIIPLLQLNKKELKNKMADKLSGGQKHQLSLAMTLATNPRLVILDEPSAGLSPKSVEEMYAMLHYIRDKYGVTIVLIEQNIAKAVDFCDICDMIKTGRIVKSFVGQLLNISEVECLMFNDK